MRQLNEMVAETFFGNFAWEKASKDQATREGMLDKADRVIQMVNERGQLREDGILEKGHLTVDIFRGLTWQDGAPIDLTPNQVKLLRFMMTNANHSISYRELLLNVWGPGYTSAIQYLRVTISDIRRKGIKGIKPHERFGYELEVVSDKPL